MVEIDGTKSASPHGRKFHGHQRRRSLSMLEAHAPQEVVTLRKQLMQERKNAEEWMIDYAIEEALQRLAPAKESKVKALVEAFESVIIPNKETSEAVSATVAQEHQLQGSKPASNVAIKA
ncbi:hypothetical protein KP509_17G001500 [Ceratopteris richardii]|nr:hypothetical protein KP509_17G001500 [Ceratopteris richardii]